MPGLEVGPLSMTHTSTPRGQHYTCVSSRVVRFSCPQLPIPRRISTVTPAKPRRAEWFPVSRSWWTNHSQSRTRLYSPLFHLLVEELLHPRPTNQPWGTGSSHHSQATSGWLAWLGPASFVEDTMDCCVYKLASFKWVVLGGVTFHEFA